MKRKNSPTFFPISKFLKTTPNEWIGTVYHKQTKCLTSIAKLYTKSGFECDISYGNGNFYKSTPELKPKLKLDISPKIKGVIPADSQILPLKSSSMNNIIWDPPFLTRSKPHPKFRMGNLFTTFNNIDLLWEYYQNTIAEVGRVLKNKGILIVKCQDLTRSGWFYISHTKVLILASKIGLGPIDLFVLINKTPIPPFGPTQVHAKKQHSFFWIFRKGEKNYAF